MKVVSLREDGFTHIVVKIIFRTTTTSEMFVRCLPLVS